NPISSHFNRVGSLSWGSIEESSRDSQLEEEFYGLPLYPRWRFANCIKDIALDGCCCCPVWLKKAFVLCGEWRKGRRRTMA
ncbi:hypothetical protein CEXT_717711, partial [Caerostris extrusa]